MKESDSPVETDSTVLNSREKITDPVLITALAKADKLVGESNLRPSFDDFMKRFPGDRAEIKAEQIKVRNKQVESERLATPEQIEAKWWAYLMEIMLHEFGQTHNWFGQESRTYLSAEGDDWLRWIDARVEFTADKDNKEVVQSDCVLDFTFSDGFLAKKFENSIGRSYVWPATMKYYWSELESETGAGRVREGIPPAIIGLSFRNVKWLADLWVKGNGVALENHPAQIAILKQMEANMELFRDQARKLGQEDFAQRCEDVCERVNKLLTEKEPKIFAEDEDFYDPIAEAVLAKIKQLRKDFGLDK